MHPRYLRELLETGEEALSVFVAMSFDPRFAPRFERVICPAITSVMANNQPLSVHRVDRSNISDSIIAEIVEGIAHDIFVFADISSIGSIDGRPVRNGNVMYELGLAHAMRNPEDVIVFRSDNDPLLFDVSGIRVNSYSPDDNPEEAEKAVARAIVDAAQYKNRMNKAATERALRSLDPASIGVLFRIAGLPMLGPRMETVQAGARDSRLIPCFQRILTLGLAEVRAVPGMSPENPRPVTLDDFLTVQITKLGWHVVEKLLERSGISGTLASLRPDLAKQWNDSNRDKASGTERDPEH